MRSEQQARSITPDRRVIAVAGDRLRTRATIIVMKERRCFDRDGAKVFVSVKQAPAMCKLFRDENAK